MIPVAAHVMHVCNLTGTETDQLDKSIKAILREHNIHGRQSAQWWTFCTWIENLEEEEYEY